MKIVTIFKNITDSKTPYFINPETIYAYIKAGRYKDKVLELRKISDKKERDKIKGTLPSICWSGEFERRANNAIKKHSGLVCIDFDHVENLPAFKSRICYDKYTYMCFISPSGDGLKVIIKIPESIETHADSCRAITDYYKEESLDEFKDIARVCYISFDPEIYINKDSDVFNTLLKEVNIPSQTFYPKDRVSDTNEIYERIIKWLDSKETYTDGNKHKYLVRLASACLRFGIPQYECSSRLYFNYGNRASKVSQQDIDKIVSRIYSNYSSVSCSAHFEQNGEPVYTASKKEFKYETIDIEVADKDIIYLENVKQSMFEGFKTGKAKGETTHIKSFDKHWTWRRKEVTFVGGIGNAGKTTMINNLCVLKAMHNDWKFAIFSPEQDPPDDFYNDLIHTYIGESTEPYHYNQMKEETYKKAMDFISSHFFYIYPESESPTPEYINICFEHAVKKHKVDVCIIDPFNQLDNDWKKNNRDDLYISEFLSNCTRFSQKHDIAYLIAGHPKGNLQKVGGNYEIPNVYDYAGGAMWNNKCHNILCYHRPNAQTNPEDTTCLFVSQKIKKRKLTGIPGTAKLNFDPFTNRFIEEDGNNPFVIEQEKIQTIPLTPVNNFYEVDNFKEDKNEVPF